MKRLLVGGAVLALGIGSIGMAQAAPPSGAKVTGGGQIIADNVQGPGDTIAFQVQNINGATGDADSDAARGQVQSVEREGAGRPTDKFHGEAACLVVVANTARFAGVVRGAGGGFFRVDIVDNGQGDSSPNDMVVVQRSTEPLDCDDDASGDETDLARGNVKIHQASS